VNDARVDPFDAARERLQDARRRRRSAPRADAPDTIVPVAPAAPDEPLTPSRIDAARARLRLAIPPRADEG
jgi:hypothetical protein